jgi:hypothetical protein
MEIHLRGPAHDQPAVSEEGRGDGHPEADALVNVQLICGLAYDAVERLRCAEESWAHDMPTGLTILEEAERLRHECFIRW